MGIPRLRGHLDRWSQNQVLGCTNPNCQHTAPALIIIDGPSLAYHIYSKVAATERPYIQPSYDDLGEAILTFLQTLENASLTIAALFFDGFLPIGKRSVRLERLQRTLTQLASLRASHPLGLSTTAPASRSKDLSTEHLFSPVSINGLPRGLPNAPSVVPATLDALRNSRFADRIHLVPNEADVYCAAHARTHGGYVLSNDSDLVVHDLGANGVVVFLDTLRLDRCGSCGGPCVTAKVFDAVRTASRISVADFRRFAFEVKEDCTVTAGEAMRKAQGSLRAAKGLRLKEFCVEYGDGALATLGTSDGAEVLEPWQHLDPRLAEFMVQLRLSPKVPVHVYLPVLLEDTAKVSAWEVGQDVRRFSYSAMVHGGSGSSSAEILEYDRRGSRVVPFRVEIMDKEQCKVFAAKFNEQIAALKGTDEGPLTAPLWRVFGAAQAILWYVCNGYSFPETSLFDQALNEISVNDIRSWKIIHFNAQVQAYLYSLRQAKQLLECLDQDQLDDSLIRMAEILQTLPTLDIPVVTHREANGVNVKEVVKFARSLAGLSENPVPAEEINKTGAVSWEVAQASKAKKRGKKKGKENKTAPHTTVKLEVDPTSKSKNMYDLLARHP